MNNLNKLNIILKQLVKEKDNKPIFKILWELLCLTISQKKFPDYYFSRFLYKKSGFTISNFVPNVILYKLASKLNNPSFATVLDNKILFPLFLEGIGASTIKTLMYNIGPLLYVKDKALNIDTQEKFNKLIKDYFVESPQSKGICIKQAIHSYGGDNIFFLHRDSELHDGLLKEIYQAITPSCFVFQELITQHDLLNQINPSCINSIRLVTYMEKSGMVHLLGAFLRFSVTNANVDNISFGGSAVAIDLESGKLNSKAYSSITKSGGTILHEHPITKVRFQYFTLPYFEEMKDMVIKSSSHIKGVRLIGWDIAIQPEGPIIIEGNDRPDMAFLDLMVQGLNQNAGFKKLMIDFQETN